MSKTQNFAGAGHTEAAEYFKQVSGALLGIPVAEFVAGCDAICTALKAGGMLFVAGNGGNSAAASHVVNDMLKSAHSHSGDTFRAMSLCDNVPVITATGNDNAFTEIFSVPLSRMARTGDVLLVMSASGNSPNILAVLEAARARGIVSVGFYGMGGGAAVPLTTFPVVVPSSDYGPIEDAHLAMCHALSAHYRDFSSQS